MMRICANALRAAVARLRAARRPRRKLHPHRRSTYLPPRDPRLSRVPGLSARV